MAKSRKSGKSKLIRKLNKLKQANDELYKQRMDMEKSAIKKRSKINHEVMNWLMAKGRRLLSLELLDSNLKIIQQDLKWRRKMSEMDSLLARKISKLEKRIKSTK